MPRYTFDGEDKKDGLHWAVCPDCQERRFLKRRPDEDDDEYEKPKKKHPDYYDRCCPAWPEWLNIPPWLWPEKREPEKKEPEKKEPEKKEPEKKRDSGELEAYGYIFQFSGSQVVVYAGSDVVFTNNGLLKCISHDLNSPYVTIRKSGVYEIFYSVNAASTSGPALIGLAVNDTTNPITNVIVGGTPGLAAGKVQLALKAGDVLTLRNTSTSGASITLAGAPSLGAQLTLERIDKAPFDHCDEIRD